MMYHSHFAGAHQALTQHSIVTFPLDALNLFQRSADISAQDHQGQKTSGIIVAVCIVGLDYYYPLHTYPSQ